MIVTEKQKDVQVLSQGEVSGTIDMSLDLDSQQMLMQMLSKNLYSDEIGSTVRELASNALDSHRRAGVDKPIIVSLKQNAQYNWEFCVEDFGVGLDDSDITNIISKYGKSMARFEADALGMMGLGFKSPLAYTSSFYFVGRKNGVERKWMMYESDEGNKIDPLYEQPTEEPDGVKVIVPVKFTSVHDFRRKINEQLAYFEGVYFDGTGLINDFKIYRDEHFQWSELSNDTSMHICLDNVYYPLDFKKMEISHIGLPIALRFGLKDGIYPTPNRESLRYTPEAKAKIKAKIALVADYFLGRFNDQIKEVEKASDVFDFYLSQTKNLDIAGKKFDVTPLKKYTTSVIMNVPRMKGVKYLDMKALSGHLEYLTAEYKISYQLNRIKMSELKSERNVHVKDLEKYDYYVFSNPVSGNMREYLKSIATRDTLLVRKSRPYKLGTSRSLGFDNYYNILNLDNYSKHRWRDVIKEFQLIQSQYIGHFKDLDSMTIPKEWLEKRKRMRVHMSTNRKVKLQGEVSCKVAMNLEKSISDRNCKFVATTYKLQDMHKHPALTIYTHHDDWQKLDPLYGASRRLATRFLTFSDRELKVINQLGIHNLMSYEKFMKGDNKPFKRMVTAYLINKLIEANKNMFDKMYILEPLSKDFHSKLTLLNQYKNKYYSYGGYQIYEAMLEVARNNNAFDPEIYDVFIEVRDMLKRMPFVGMLMRVAPYSGGYISSTSDRLRVEEIQSMLRDLFKHHKKRLDVGNYKLVVDEVVPEEQDEEDVPLTDEELESLVEDEDEVLEEDEV